MITAKIKAVIAAAGVAIVLLGGMNLYQRYAIGQLEGQIATLNTDKSTLQTEVYTCESNKRTLEQAIERQNERLAAVQRQGEERAARAEERASKAEEGLREALERDRETTPDAEGMNRWLESLY